MHNTDDVGSKNDLQIFMFPINLKIQTEVSRIVVVDQLEKTRTSSSTPSTSPSPFFSDATDFLGPFEDFVFTRQRFQLLMM